MIHGVWQTDFTVTPSSSNNATLKSSRQGWKDSPFSYVETVLPARWKMGLRKIVTTKCWHYFDIDKTIYIVNFLDYWSVVNKGISYRLDHNVFIFFMRLCQFMQSLLRMYKYIEINGGQIQQLRFDWLTHLIFCYLKLSLFLF